MEGQRLFRIVTVGRGKAVMVGQYQLSSGVFGSDMVKRSRLGSISQGALWQGSRGGCG